MRLQRIALLIAMSAVLSAAKSLPAVPPVTLSGAWTSVGLPDEPLDVVAHDGKLWVSGANEMIAVSADEGRTWTVENEKHNGEMLFALVFPVPNDIVAYGSAGVRIESRDGGQSWKRTTIRPGVGVALVAQTGAFAVAAAGNDFGVSTDSGQHWQFRALRSKRAVVQVATLGTEHGLVLFEGDKTGQEVATTEDGGVTWASNTLPGYDLGGVRAGPSGYALCGFKLAGGDPAEVHSSDGVEWRAAPAPVRFHDCGAKGCLIPKGWADLTGASPVYWEVPPDKEQPLTQGWAAVGDTFCRASSELRCRKGRKPWEAPVTAAANSKFSGGGCQHCPAPGYPLAAKGSGQQGVVTLLAIIGKDGKIRQTLVQKAPSAVLALAARETVEDWTYHPLLADGQPVEVDTIISVNFALNR